MLTNKTPDAQDLTEAWETLLNDLEASVGKRPGDLNSVLFLIGVQELGKGPIRFTKEQKQDLMHVAVCTVLSLSGYFRRLPSDADGWPHFEQTESVPPGDLLAQETLLKTHIIHYFAQS